MDGRAAHAAGQRRPAQLNAAGKLKRSSHEAAPAPARLPFLLLLFFWVSKRKEDFKTQKKFISPISVTSPTVVDSFCKSTLSKKGLNPRGLL
ncbi:MAG: hypothetical protein II902_11295 [Selenomonadaceae bacterium]|nr:hypothetical protein [Selenomonadaceae bacterium]